MRLQCLAGVEGLAILTSADFLLDIHRLAVDNDIEPSPSCVGGWKVWAPAVRFLGQGHQPPGSPGAPCCCPCSATWAHTYQSYHIASQHRPQNVV